MDNRTEDLLQAYLAGTIRPDEKLEFEQMIAADAQLAAQLEFEQRLYDAIGADSPENKLRRNLKAIAEKYPSPESLHNKQASSSWKQYRLWLVLLGLLVAGSTFWLLQQPETPAPPTQIQPETTPPAPGTPPVANPEIASETENTSQRQLIAANFKPNERLETYIGSQNRGGGVHFQVNTPKAEATLLWETGKFQFRLQGKATGDSLSEQNYKLLIFNNNVRDFENMKALVSIPLHLEGNGDFKTSCKVSGQPGLFYFLLEDQQTGEWAYVHKFYVREQ